MGRGIAQRGDRSDEGNEQFSRVHEFLLQAVSDLRNPIARRFQVLMVPIATVRLTISLSLKAERSAS